MIGLLVGWPEGWVLSVGARVGQTWLSEMSLRIENSAAVVEGVMTRLEPFDGAQGTLPLELRLVLKLDLGFI